MATTRTFQDMLNEYLTYDMLKTELIKRDWLLSTVEKDNGWKGGDLIVPFKASGASSVAFGELTASNDIAEDKFVRGKVSGQKEMWGTMIFNHRDLQEHDGSVSEKSFLKILPDAVEDFMEYIKMVASIGLLNGAHFAKATADGLAGGTIAVDRPDRFALNQKVLVASSAVVAVAGYVSAIDMNTSVITITAARNGAGGAVNLAAFLLADGTKLFHPGVIAVGQNTGTLAGTAFTSLREQLLSAAAGGSTNLFGVPKTSAPYLQAINIDGTALDASNILEKLFDAYMTIRIKGRGNPMTCVMSYKNFASALKKIESSKGAYNVEPGSQKTSVYGWTEIQIGGVKGMLKLIAIQELDDDVIMFLDMRAMKFHSNGFFKKRVAPDGKHYHEVRATSGYQYLIDIALFGELVVSKPSLCGIIHTVDY